MPSHHPTAPEDTPAPAAGLNRRTALTAMTLALTACGGGGGGAAEAATPTPPAPPAPTPPAPAPTGPTVNVSFANVAVHDPSVLRVNGTWYVFGSHLAAAKSSDLLNWQLVASGVDNNNPLFTNVLTTLAPTFAWSQVNGLWAADVAQLPDGRFAHYFNSCKGDSPRSAMGIAYAASVEGPYTQPQIFLKSGMWDEISEDGKTVYDARVHPNAVDPQAFKDQAGAWWLLYGSYSGGLFILALDPATGLPQPGQGYGQHLVGGNHARIEGGYILYSPLSQYYYLFMSFGGLDANGAYHLRVARSRNPNGPFVDGQGRDMRQCKSDPTKPLFDDASIAPYGQKLLGNHQFALAAGETGTALGYVSPGHNSAAIDAASGRHLLFMHTRFPGRGEAHEVRVHEFHLNAEAWPVVAPLRYVPLAMNPTTLTPEVSAADAAGSYKLVNHGKDITASVKASVVVSLLADGSLGGAMAGRWSHDGSNRVTVTPTGQAAFSGVLSRGWNPNTSAFTVCFSALSAEGVALWGLRTGPAA